jgi:hypothetical protein
MLSKLIGQFLNHKLGYDPRLNREKQKEHLLVLREKGILPHSSLFAYLSKYESLCTAGKRDIGVFGDVILLWQDTDYLNMLKEKGVPEKYLPLSRTRDWFFLYDKEEDSVLLNDDDDPLRLSGEDFDYYWPSFDQFLCYFFGLSESH